MLSATPSSFDPFGLDPSAINSSSSSTKKKKKNKRPHEDEPQNEHSGELQKRQKRNDRPEEESVAEDPADIENSHIPDVGTAEKPKKKKKKDKGKSKALSEQTDAEIEANSQASAAALLSAIVAASVTNSDAAQIQAPPPPVDPSLTGPPPVHQYDPYPPMHPYGYPLAPPPFDPNVPPPSVFSPPPPPVEGGGPFSELSFGSNEDLLRALQDLDMSKIASVLKNLGDAATANHAQATPLSYVPDHLMQLHPATLGHNPTPSNSILGIDPKQTMAPTGHRRIIDMNLAGNEQHSNPEHAYILANKWLNPSKLAELVRDEGLVYKKGKFSAIEEDQLRAALENFRQSKQLDQDGLTAKIFSRGDKTKDTAFWSELTAAVPLRPIIAVYHHVRRHYHPLKQQGSWKTNEDEALTQAVADYGQQWEKVSFRVGRMASDCRDRYRNHIYNREMRITGHWSPEEEDRLTEIVTEMTIKQGKNPDNDVFWGRVSELMGGSRGRQQCRIKWTDALSKTVKNEGQKPRWSQQDAFILVHKVDSLSVRDDTEIDWKLIPDPDWNLWSAHTLQRRWLTMKKGVKGYEDMTHQEIMDILRVKKAHLPTLNISTPRKKKERKVVSAPAVNEPDMRDTDSTPQPGSSTGPGTGSLS